MAASPPLVVMDDQTDEDFFDKLVDDDFEPGDSASKFGEGGSDSDEARAFTNLSIEDTVGDGVSVRPELSIENETVELPNVPVEEVSRSEFESTVSDGVQAVTESVSDLAVSNASGSVILGVKEVGWNSFHADMVPNGNHGFGSYSDFFIDRGDNADEFFGEVDGHTSVANNSEDFFGKVDTHASLTNVMAAESGLEKSLTNEGNGNGTQIYGGSKLAVSSEQDVNSSGCWENMYPGWKYDPSSGQWYQVDNFDMATNAHENHSVEHKGNEWAAVSDGKIEASYLQQSSHSVVGATQAETSTIENVTTWSQVPPGSNNGYPEHMYFDPQYPGWYYDMLTQEWRSLESYTTSVQSSAVMSQDQQIQNEMAFGSQYFQDGSAAYNDYGQSNKFGSQNYGSQVQQQVQQHSSWGESYSNSYNQPSSNMWQPGTISMTNAGKSFGGNQQFANSYVSNASVNNHADHQATVNSLATVSSYENLSQRHVQANGFVGSQAFVSGGHFGQQFNQANLDQKSFSSNYYGSQKPTNTAQESVQSNQQFSYASNAGRSSAGRPPHALVTFGFGGKLMVMRASTSNSSFSAQDPVGGTISVLNLMECALASSANTRAIGSGSCSYFHALCQQSFPGPLVGGSVGNKELNKWIDDRITSCESPDMDYREGEVLKLLLSLLRISCQHYGKLRSPFGSDVSLRDNDSPESAVAKLFASVRSSNPQMNAYGAIGHCLQNLPSDGQIRATASEVQHLLVSGRKIEALQRAQEGQLWGPALVLASQLGNQFYIETVKQMALRQLVAGSPLRTLCLLIAGQPREVFSTGTFNNSLPSGFNASQQPMQSEANVVVDEWEENLAVITANRTKDDELVIIHLGDCLWKDRSEIIGAHICYLVAEAKFEPYSDSARLCLISADHWKHPRTYASPEAIQRTELYEYAKVLGNSQFILLPFQPYKLIYAYMLAEVGKVSDSLKYCQALLKSLKTGRSPEVETWRQLVTSLEDRLRTHQQGGYATNLAPAKLVGKLLNFFDSTAHRVVGGLPPPAPSTSHGSVQHSEHVHPNPMVPRVSASQSTMAMSSLMPSASVEPINEWTTDSSKRAMHNRSVSEPDFGRSPRQVDSSKKESSSSSQGQASNPVSSRFGRFGFGSQILQKTVGLLRPRSDKQAKLGEKNKFYYDEKLKRWVEEGVEPPAEETALPPPPTTSAFQNGMNDYNLMSALKKDEAPAIESPMKSPSSMEHTSGIPPPIPISSNQFSARGRVGVRARYVDTFNQGGGALANSFQSPTPSVKPAMAANAKFFIPAPAPTADHSMESIAENTLEDIATTENSVTSTANVSFRSPQSSSSVTMQRFPSMDNISRKGAMNGGNGLHSSHSRRTASWSGSLNDAMNPAMAGEFKLPGSTLGMSPPSSTPSGSSATPLRGNSFGDELQEVEL